MTIFSDEVLMLNAAEMEEWYEHELILRSEHELRMRRVKPIGSPAKTVSSSFGVVADRINMLHPAYADGTNTGPAPFGVILGTNGDLVNSWIPGGSSTVPNNFLTLGGFIPAPDGTTNTAQKLVEANTNQTHSIVAGLKTVALSNYTVTTWRLNIALAPAERTRAVVAMTNSSFNQYNGAGTAQFPGAAGVKILVDLVAGAIVAGPTAFGAGFVAGPASVTKLPNGFVLCQIDGTGGIWYNGFTFPTVVLAYVYIDGASSGPETTSYLGDGKSGIYAWRGNLLPIDAYNLKGQQIFFDEFLSDATIDVNHTNAPGFNWYPQNSWASSSSLQATLVEGVNNDFDVSNSILHMHCQQTGTPNFVYSAFGAGFRLNGTARGNIFTLPGLFECRCALGTIPAAGPPGVPISFWSQNPDAFALINPISPGFPPPIPSCERDLTEFGDSFPTAFSNFQILEWESDFPTDTHFQINATSLPFNSISDTNQHIYSSLILPQAAGNPAIVAGQHNILPNTDFSGAVAGSPGTPPNRMAFVNIPAGLTVTTSLPGGGVYQIRFQTAGLASQQSVFFVFDTGPINSAAGTIGPNQIWSGSVQYSRVAESTALSKQLQIGEFDISGAQLDGTGFISIIEPVIGSGFTPFSVTYRTQLVNGARLRFSMLFVFAASTAYDSTIQFFQPQLEQSTFPTTFQPAAGADTQGVPGVAFTDAPPFYGRMYSFFDKSSVSDLIYSSHTGFHAQYAGVSPNNFVSVDSKPIMLILSCSDKAWPCHYDWVSVIQ